MSQIIRDYKNVVIDGGLTERSAELINEFGNENKLKL